MSIAFYEISTPRERNDAVLSITIMGIFTISFKKM
jgi:hypothetical protein